MIFNYARFANVSVLNIVCILHDNHGNNGMEFYLYFLIALIWFDLISFGFDFRFASLFIIIWFLLSYYTTTVTVYSVWLHLQFSVLL